MKWREREKKKKKRQRERRPKEKKNRRKKEKNEAVDPAAVVAEFGWTSHGILWARYGVYEGRSRV